MVSCKRGSFVAELGKIHCSPGHRKWAMIQVRRSLMASRAIYDQEIDNIRTAIVSGRGPSEETFQNMLIEHRASEPAPSQKKISKYQRPLMDTTQERDDIPRR